MKHKLATWEEVDSNRLFLLHVDIERNDVHDTPSDDITTQGGIS